MFGKKASVGSSVASEMYSLMNSDGHKKIFSGPSFVVKTAAKKKDEEEDKKDKKDKKEDKKDVKKKPSKKEAYSRAVSGLNAISEIFDDLGLEKSAVAAIRALEVVVKEAQEVGDAFYADDNDALTHDHEHTHSKENPAACHTHSDMSLADDASGYAYSDADKQILKELEDAFGGPEKLKEMVDQGQFSELFDSNSDEDDEVRPEVDDPGSAVYKLMQDIPLPEQTEGAEPVDEAMQFEPDDKVQALIKEELAKIEDYFEQKGEALAPEDIEFITRTFGGLKDELKAKAYIQDFVAKIKKEGPANLRVKAMIVLAPSLIKQAAGKKK